MSWFRKYRPTSIANLHLDSVRKLLSAMLISGSFPQVFLFSGPKGTGKTSTARIIGAILNDPRNYPAIDQIYFSATVLPEKKPILLDNNSGNANLASILTGDSALVLEIDGASNRGIDDVRQLRDRLYLPPSFGKMMVVIIDEVHMFTVEAFNSLLKILEEPPPHVVFILATTEEHKLPKTVISRCQLIPFHKASPQEIQQSLKQILTAEDKQCDPKIMQLIIEKADGSFRDAVKNLEIVINADLANNLEQASLLIQSLSPVILFELANGVFIGDQAGIVRTFCLIKESHLDGRYLIEKFIQYLEKLLLLQFEQGQEAVSLTSANLTQAEFDLSKNTDWLIRMIDSLLKDPLLTQKIDQILGLEIKLLSLASLQNKKDVLNQPVVNLSKDDLPNKQVKQITQKDKTRQISVGKTISQSQSKSTNFGQQSWRELSNIIATTQPTLGALLKSTSFLSLENNEIVVEVFYTFHFDQLTKSKNKQLIDRILSKHWPTLKLVFRLSQKQGERLMSFQSLSQSNSITSLKSTPKSKLSPNSSLEDLAEEFLN